MITEIPELKWEAATGYDFFVSLHVLHVPDQFALRASWAKGVRTRLPAEARAFFEETSQHLLAALHWAKARRGNSQRACVVHGGLWRICLGRNSHELGRSLRAL